MFSGLVEEIGVIQSCITTDTCKTLGITAGRITEDMRVGDSISVNGVCLTVISFNRSCFTVQAIPETLRLTNIADLQEGNAVNLERALRVSDRIGGHLIQGHVDGTTALLQLIREGEALNAIFATPPFWQGCLIPKGFIALDGMSLTITHVTDTTFGISFIPHTIATTIVQHYQLGHQINVEIDHLTKSIMTILKNQKGITHG